MLIGIIVGVILDDFNVFLYIFLYFQKFQEVQHDTFNMDINKAVYISIYLYLPIILHSQN